VFAPVAVSVLDFPAQMADGFALTEMTGDGLTTTVTVCVPTQPNALAPETVYCVVTSGATTRGLLVDEPGFQV
jgi:hypothetical protein